MLRTLLLADSEQVEKVSALLLPRRTCGMNYFSQMTPLISLKKNEIQSVAEPHRALHLVTRTFKNLYCRYFILTVAVSTGPVTTHRLRPMKLDPRPVSDQRYIQSCVRSIAERLSGVDLPGKPTNRQLDAKDFKAFVEKSFKLLDIQRGNQIIAEEDLVILLRYLHYPFQVGKTCSLLQNLATNLPTLSLAFSWLLQLGDYGANGRTQKHAIEGESFVHRVTSSYKFFLCGQDQKCSEACENLLATVHKQNDMWMRDRTKLEHANLELQRSLFESKITQRNDDLILSRLAALRQEKLTHAQKAEQYMKQLQENSTHCASVHRNMHMHEGKSTTLRWSSQAADTHISQCPAPVTENVSASLRTKIGKLKQNLSQLSAEHAIWSLRLELPISDAVETSSVVQDRLYLKAISNAQACRVQNMEDANLRYVFPL